MRHCRAKCDERRNEQGTRARAAKRAFSACIVIAILQTGNASGANAESRTSTEIGSLDCIVGSSAGLLAGRQFARCTFRPADTDANKRYFVRLSQALRAPGLPSGGKLVWTVQTLEAGATPELSGRYSQIGQAAAPDRNPYTLCRSLSPPVCMTPAQAAGGRKPNLAPVILEMSVEVSPIRRRKPAESK